MGLIIDALIAFFMEAILKLLLKGSLMIAQLILDKSITSFQNGSNIIMAAMGLLNLEEIELGELFIGIGKGLILTLFLLQLITELAKATVGEQAQQPLQIIGRCVLSYLLLIIIFGSSLFKNNTILGGGLLKLLGEFGANILSKINVDIAPPDKLGDWIGIDLLKPAEQFGLLIMYAALMGSVLGATISYVERVISLALSAIMGPLCISLYSVKELQHYAKGWLVNIMVQIACIFVSLCMWSLFLQRLDFTADSVFELAILVVVLNLMKDSEQIFKSLGFQTMPNIDTAKAMMGGFANTLTTFKNVRAFVKFI